MGLDGWQQALFATLFTWGMTAAGASLVFFFKRVGDTASCLMLSGAAGIMLASSFFSLLLPALEGVGNEAWLALTCAFAAGGCIIAVTDIVAGFIFEKGKNSRSSAVMCVAVTMHNIPEGLAVGVAFGAAAFGGEGGLAAAAMLALGIGIQNFPEGMCVAFPLRANGLSRGRSFFIGQLSGAVEVVAGVVGVLAVAAISWLLPFALSFSAGAMVAVVCAELVPQSFSAGKVKATAGVIAGFALMMALDIAFG